MASKDYKELLTSASQPENVENDANDDGNIAACEKKDFLAAVEDDRTDKLVENEDIKSDKSEEVNTNTVVPSTVSENTVDTSTTIVDGHEKADEGDKDVGNDKKAETINSNSNKETKKIGRKRKNNAEEIPAVSSPPTALKKKLNDTSAIKIKEAQPFDKAIEENEMKELKSDEKLESEVIPEVEEKEKSGRESKKVVKKAVTRKIAPKAKGASSNSDSLPTKLADVAAVTPTSSIPAVKKKDIDGTKDNSSVDTGKLDSSSASEMPLKKAGDEDKPSPTASEKPLKKVDNADKPNPLDSKKPIKKADDGDKQLKKVDGMGLVFICNAKTKKDCFKYNVLGLPKSKKDLVAKIYKGMRLFLFDVDLKLMYGIYKAAGPGGYNIEPKAFDSKFPAQVHFTVLRDCLPLPEEKFKAAIKENYYKRNHFDCQLSPEQVGNLCKLFQNATSKASKSTHRPGSVRVAAGSSARELKRRPAGRYAREAYLSPPRVRYQSPPRLHYQSPPRVRYQSPPPTRYLSPPPPALPVHVLPRAVPYAYEQPVDDYYRRALEQDPYFMYRESARYPEPPAYPPALPLAYAARQPRSPPRYLY